MQQLGLKHDWDTATQRILRRPMNEAWDTHDDAPLWKRLVPRLRPFVVYFAVLP